MQSASDVISSLFWFRADNELDEEKEPAIIEQFVQNVEDFSSQYGSEISVSYTAFNLRGTYSIFPDYGDYPQAFVMRTYGTWWDEAPSAPEDFMPQNSSRAITSQDFVEVSFERAVYPMEVSVFETYNPGALVRIWAWGTTSWVLLWEGEPEYVGDTPRIFCPSIRQINIPTRILRLEFNHRLLPYYTELDAVLLKGKEPEKISPKNPMSCSTMYCKKQPNFYERGEILNRIMSSNLHETIVPPKTVNIKQKIIDTGPTLGDFHPLPDETILGVMKYLDIQSLCRCAQVNKHFNRLASDAILYRSIDLRPYWHCVQSQVLVTLSMRCKYLQKFDISWCGSHRMIHPEYVVNFLRDNGSELRHLRMNCCKFVDDSVLNAIIESSTHLEELCLRSVTGCNSWSCLSYLTKLRRLDLYRTDVTSSAVVAIVRANPGLRHLNLGSCKMISSMDEVAIALGANCPDLISVDFWKSYSLTPNGIRALGNCKKLQELDVGWCVQAGSSGEWLSWLAGGELRKLFLGALRGVCDRDLRALLPRAPKLMQLDLLGVRAVTPDICDIILSECRELRLLDVSFCDQIQESQVHEWRRQYPHVSIKRSFQAANLTIAPNPLFLAPSLE